MANIDGTLIGTLSNAEYLTGELSISAGRVTDYNKLINKPQVEGVTLIGDKSFSDLGLDTASFLDIEEILQS